MFSCHSSQPVGPDFGHYRKAVAESASQAELEPGSTAEKEAIERFYNFYEIYSYEQIKNGLRELYADDAYFGDPFHSVEGIDEIENYFLFMAEPVVECTFSIESMDRAGRDYYSRWNMHLISKAAPKKAIDAIGFSHVRFNAEGKIIFQQDYWDSSVLMDRLPVVGYWTRMVKRKLEPPKLETQDE